MATGDMESLGESGMIMTIRHSEIGAASFAGSSLIQVAPFKQPRTKLWGCLILYIVWPAARIENAPCQSGSKPSLTPCACNPGKLSDTDTGNIVGAPRTASLSGMGG